ncbi:MULTISPECIES: TonB-dependent siderophore receptor [unclassified Pseudomonas]|uniref:TonB-dependent siderophore receptor n=1 Tax=unclassified Pseudomonas TaxID=196821 RepID=UPI0005BA8771|nr:TonB-dependent siderophore receptor [Pseudomonas sp. M47T1]
MRRHHPFHALCLRTGAGLMAFALAPSIWAADPAPVIDDSVLATLPQVTVKAAKAKKPDLHKKMAAGALGSKAAIDTPFSVKSISSEEIQQRQAGILSEAVKYDASVTSISSSYGTHPATLAVRGLPLDDLNGYKVDGMANINRGVEMPLEMFDSIEVLKGLSGFMYGFGSPGGIVNYVTKRPTDKTVFSVAAGYQSNNLYKEQVDVGGRLDDPRFGYRLNLVHEEGNAASGHAAVNRTAVGLSLDAKLTDDLTLNFDTLYQQRATSGGTDIIVNTAYALPKPIDGSKRLYSNGSYTDVDYSLSTLSATYQFSPDWQGKLAYRYSDSDRRYTKDQYTITSNSGNYSDKASTEYHGYDYNDAMGTLEGKFTTGWFSHDVVLGASYSELDSHKSAQATTKATVGKGNLYDPTLSSVYQYEYWGGTYGDDQIKEAAVFASDTIGLGEHWSLLLGLRNENFREKTHDAIGTDGVNYRARPATPTVALMYKPIKDVTVYTSYVESLEAGGSAPDTAANYPAVMGPLRSKQYELGVKAQRRNWSATAAAFRIDRGAEYTNSDNEYVQSGTIRYQGLEFNATVDPIDSLTLEGSVMSLDSEYIDAGDVDGNRAAGAAHYQAAAQATYRIGAVPGLFVRAGAQRIGPMAVDSGNVNTLDAYNLFDAGGGYRFKLAGGHALTFGANVTNLANHKYWTWYQENYLQPGSPRTLSVNARYDF